MKTIRSGKIARLPSAIREELNQRLAGHESSTPLLQWLNALPEVQAVMAERFGGREIDRHNLHEWRHGGHAEWQRERSAREMMQSIMATGTSVLPPSVLSPTAGNGTATDRVAAWLAARYLAAAREFAKDAARDKTAWNHLRECCSDLAALQRTEHRARRLEFERVRAATHAVGAP